MEIFGIGPLELILIFFIALIVLGPNRMIDSAKKSAEWIRKLRQSDAWKTTKEVMDIPTQVIKETGLDKEIRELNSLSSKAISTTVWNGDVLSKPHQAPVEKKADTAAQSQPTIPAGEQIDDGKGEGNDD